MNVQAIVWAGIRTERTEEMVSLFRDVLGLAEKERQSGMTSVACPNGDTVEVFTTEEPEHTFFTTGPVVGFLVDDVDAARRDLEAAGVELIGEVGRGGGYAWQHFRGPDGNVYEVTQGSYRS